MYACGVTVYDEIHLGHARQAIIFDILRSFLEYRGFAVDYVRNYTDVDDKIIKRAILQNKTSREVSEYYIRESETDLNRLKVKPATWQPKVTEHIPEIIAFIEGLVKNGYAYVNEGEVLFNVDKFDTYGKLSHRKTDEMISQEETKNKINFYDFSLWKPAKEGEPFWESPWGKGRPGWHIECSAMAKRYLGECIDIHGGGIDLIFPHHENEIAQSEALSRKQFANIWIHNGLVMVNAQKMSKSLGNFYTVKDLLKKFTADEIRFAVLVHNYSTPIDFSDDLFLSVKKRVYYFYNVLVKIDDLLGNYTGGNEAVSSHDEILDLEKVFIQAMENNLNTAQVIAELSTIFSRVNELLDDRKNDHRNTIYKFRENLRVISGIFRIFDETPHDYVQSIKHRFIEEHQISLDEIDSLLEERNKAKLEKNYDRADAIRKELILKGISLQDLPGKGTQWDIIL